VRDDDLILWGGVGLGLAVLALWKGPDVVAAVQDVVTRGGLLTYTNLDDYGQVVGDPEELRQAASLARGFPVDLDGYSLARMVRSEGAARAKIRTHVALNDAAELGWTPHQLMVYSTNPQARGRYGKQFTLNGPGGQSATRRYATTRDPYAGDLDAVNEARVEHAAGIDPTGGAVKFVDKSSMGVQEGTGSYADLVARWGAEGLRPFTLPGESDLVVFRRAA
jgi:hypothetical protein